jgi:zona occludens toxin
MLYFITGSNGGGKSLRAVVLMEKLARSGVNVYAWNFNELRIPGVVIHENVDPVNWRDLPPNSALFVDEAQQVWRTRRGNKEEPPELRDMEEHRKAGIDIYLVAPSPTFLDNHIKPLVAQHYHCIAYGNAASRVFTFNECQDNPQGMTKRASAKFEVWDHPKAAYQWYTSAESHMKKARPPWQHYIPRVAKITIGLLLVFIAYKIWGPSEPTLPKSLSAASSLLGGKKEKAEFHYKDATELLEQFTPRVAGMPWSAPAFDGRNIAADPGVYCMSTVDTCRCFTEQASTYVMPMNECRYMARWGAPYNPYKAPRSDAVAPSAPVPFVTQEGPSSVGVVIPGTPASIGSGPGAGAIQGRL